MFLRVFLREALSVNRGFAPLESVVCGLMLVGVCPDDVVGCTSVLWRFCRRSPVEWVAGALEMARRSLGAVATLLRVLEFGQS